MVRYQPYALAIQSRFRWRHKETDRWRRLMDATCFPVDWQGQTDGPNMSQYGGNWSHLVTCAHVICPWMYPNYYPPSGPTRFVSHITLADTMTQVRLCSAQGNAVHKHFLSNHSIFVHTNPRLDLAVLHPEQMLRRSGEVKMMWLQNEGFVIRPRLELNDELNVGDYVWVYGMTAHESVFDEEKAPEPLMIPTGIRARVHARTREHFFIDTSSVEGVDKGKVHMGMCGSVVMRNGRCVGMLTATVHEDSPCKELAGTAMCTYASEIFDFLLEVERQMKNAVPSPNKDETLFEARRRDEGRPQPESKDWDLDLTRIARHIKVPQSLWRMDEKWMTEEDAVTQRVFGKTGVFNQETQENSLGYDMNSSKTGGERPEDATLCSPRSRDGKHAEVGDRRDDGPIGIYGSPESFKSKTDWQATNAREEVQSIFREASNTEEDINMMDVLRRQMDQSNAKREREQLKETIFKHTGSNAGKSDPLNAGTSGHYGGGSASMGMDNFRPVADQEAAASHSSSAHFAQKDFSSQVDDNAARNATSSARPFEQLADAPESTRQWEGGSGDLPPSSPTSNSKKLQRAREKEEKERKHQEELRKRHSGRPHDEGGFEGLWNRH